MVEANYKILRGLKSAEDELQEFFRMGELFKVTAFLEKFKYVSQGGETLINFDASLSPSQNFENVLLAEKLVGTHFQHGDAIHIINQFGANIYYFYLSDLTLEGKWYRYSGKLIAV